jgi:hypothetical protein
MRAAMGLFLSFPRIISEHSLSLFTFYSIFLCCYVLRLSFSGIFYHSFPQTCLTLRNSISRRMICRGVGKIISDLDLCFRATFSVVPRIMTRVHASGSKTRASTTIVDSRGGDGAHIGRSGLSLVNAAGSASSQFVRLWWSEPADLLGRTDWSCWLTATAVGWW